MHALIAFIVAAQLVLSMATADKCAPLDSLGSPPPEQGSALERAGPATLGELKDYVKTVVGQILAGPDVERFKRTLGGRVTLRTKYSGMGLEAVALWWIGRAARCHGVDLPNDCWTFIPAASLCRHASIS